MDVDYQKRDLVRELEEINAEIRRIEIERLIEERREHLEDLKAWSRGCKKRSRRFFWSRYVG